MPWLREAISAGLGLDIFTAVSYIADSRTRWTYKDGDDAGRDEPFEAEHGIVFTRDLSIVPAKVDMIEWPVCQSHVHRRDVTNERAPVCRSCVVLENVVDCLDNELRNPAIPR